VADVGTPLVGTFNFRVKLLRSPAGEAGRLPEQDRAALPTGTPLGDAGFLAASSVAVIFTVVFGLSIDYEVFLLSRMREAWRRTGDPEQAIHEGLRGAAAVLTGAGINLAGVFLAFAARDVAMLRQIGAGLSIAIAIDATVVRLVLLPAILRVLGRRSWWLPRRLEDALPRVEPEAT